MKNNKITAIIIFLILTIALMFWSSTEKNNNKSLGYYRTDLDGFKSTYGDLTNSLDTSYQVISKRNTIIKLEVWNKWKSKI